MSIYISPMGISQVTISLLGKFVWRNIKYEYRQDFFKVKRIRDVLRYWSWNIRVNVKNKNQILDDAKMRNTDNDSGSSSFHGTGT